MRRVLALFAMFVALVALTVPSAAVGSRGFVARPAPLLLLQDNGTYLRAPCVLSGGGARIMVCRPDLGVLPSLTFLSSPPAAPFSPSLTDPLPPPRAIEPGLPPPRPA